MSIKNKNILKKVFKKIFYNYKIKKNFEELTINSFRQWDSLSNFHFLLEIEKEFKIRLSAKEIAEIKSIRQILELLNAKNK